MDENKIWEAIAPCLYILFYYTTCGLTEQRKWCRLLGGRHQVRVVTYKVLPNFNVTGILLSDL
jgi:hypothetical protein